MQNDDCKRIANNIDIAVGHLINKVIELTIFYQKKSLSEREIRLLIDDYIKGDKTYQDIQVELFSLGKRR